MSSIKIGDRVRVKTNLQKGMGVCGEHLNYMGKEFTVIDRWGYDIVVLEGNDFNWKASSLEVIS